jgi:uncharacterized protein (TIGR02246 family)
VGFETDEEQIEGLLKEWGRLASEGDVDGLLSLTTDDVTFLTPENPPIGKDDFAAGFREMSAKARIESTHETKDIRASGDIAYVWSHLTVVVAPKDGGDAWENSGEVLTVFHKSPSGRWLLARDANLMLGAGDPDKV